MRRVSRIIQLRRGDLWGEVRRRRECLPRRHISGYLREVPLIFFLCPSVGTDSYPLKVHDSASLDGTALRSLVKCLKSLQNIHALEIRCSEYNYIPAPLEVELKGIKLPD